MLWPIDFRGSLEKIRTATLVIGGSADPITPLSHVESVHQGIAGSKLLVVEGASHVPTTARLPQVANAVRDLLSASID
jgi:3-oxoadipate enol-lactonase